MKKFFKILLAVLLTLAVLAGGTIGVLYFGFGIDIFDRSGWNVTEEGDTQYLDYYGDPLLDWQLIEGSWYYFDPAQNGAMATGWLELDGELYFLESDGTRCSGWLTDESGTYYLSPTGGAAATGWLSLEGERYYLGDDGRIVTGWTDIGFDRYYFTESGTPTTGWLELEDARYYLGEDGILYRGWLETDEGARYLDPETGAMVTGWLETEEGRCYLDQEGFIATGWTDTDEGRYYLDESGYPVTGWLEAQEGTYYLDDDGAMVVGWLEAEDSLYYFREDGTMAVGKVIIDDTASYFTSTGEYIVLVNRWNEVPEDYTLNLVSYGSWQIDAQVYDPLSRMLSDCPYYYKITSAYRSEASQQYIWDTRMTNYQASGYSYSEALAMVEAYVAIPGTSEHHLGLAVDISGSDDGCNWLGEHCWEYGFILRYPEGKSDVTGIAYERWHFRYVGTELAAELHELGLCLEEYMDMLTEQDGTDAGTASNPDLFTSSYTGAAA